MTKPMVGTAIQMLMDGGRLSLGQRVFEILAAFYTPGMSERYSDFRTAGGMTLPFKSWSKSL